MKKWAMFSSFCIPASIFLNCVFSQLRGDVQHHSIIFFLEKLRMIFLRKEEVLKKIVSLHSGGLLHGALSIQLQIFFLKNLFYCS